MPTSNNKIPITERIRKRALLITTIIGSVVASMGAGYSSYSVVINYLDDRYIEEEEFDTQIAMQAQQFEQVMEEHHQDAQLIQFNDEINLLRAKERFGEATETDKWQLDKRIDDRNQLMRIMQ